jgi:Zn-dependent metalloprotease
VLSETVLYPTTNGYQRCFHLLLSTMEPRGDWRYFIDAESGKIVDSSLATRFYHAARGKLFPQNPTDTALATGVLRNLKAPYVKLDGTHVRVENADAMGATAASGYRFYFADSDTHFDEVNCYYHIDRVYNYFKDLGFRGLKVNNKHGKSATPLGQIRATVHVGTQYDNAFYSPATGEIYFGDGSYPNAGGLRDLAKESDVMYHEFGHAVLDELRPNITGTDGAALHEAYADYFACSLTSPPESQLGEWVVPGSGMIRNLKNSAKYPGAPSEPHTRGLVWGGACWDLREKLGGEVADYLIFGSMLLITTTFPTFKYAKDQLLYVDSTYCGGEYRKQIKAIFETQRRIPL